ncbi:MAG: Rpn family recombination-promoting nuclease/putative transposase [Pirellulaceae bacterium]|jgi:predicted transposase/invertase (TIGR01784 family)|nr:Rpn family recombination-promoting nuclease/putative transposase [Pirellulaceae bacterium]
MPLGIKPTVDFAFKKIFGSPENSLALMGLLNAILDLKHPIVAVDIKNPFSYQEFAESKLIVLDIRCRDSSGRWLNVEMQVSVYGGLLERLVYYACSMYTDELSAGGNYATLQPAISICLLNHQIFPGTQADHRFQMVDLASGRKLAKAIEVHTLELTKYNLDERSISRASKLEQWAFLLLLAQDYDVDQLKALLPGIEFEQAIETIETISFKTEDKLMYDQREKAQRDYEWALSGAREEGLEEGMEKGKLTGTIQTLQELLGDEVSSDSDLKPRSIAELTAELSALQTRLRRRDA